MPAGRQGGRRQKKLGGIWGVGAAIFLWAAVWVSASTAADFISPDEIVPGMKGYGLTVFEGTEPDTFEVEAKGVMRNRFPKQDLVIIEMKDTRLLESNVVAGMSGSPIYFNGKLLGALAYGPTFSKKAVAYVTPIQNMVQELNRPAEPRRPWQTVSRLSSALDDASAPRTITAGEVVPAAAALAVSGFSDRRFKLLEKLFSPYGFIPVAAGGSEADASARSGGQSSLPGPSAFRPGDAVGVELMGGDLALTAIGTVTYVDASGRVLAFGHPFFNIGQTAMPATTAQVHMFMPSLFISYKIASPIRTLGSMVQDRQPAILIDPNRSAPMAPVTVTVENTATGRRETFRYRVIREQSLTPMLTFVGLTESLDVAEAGPMGDRTFEIQSRIGLQGREAPVVLSDLSTTPLKSLFDVLTLLENSIVDVVPTSMDFDVRVTNAPKTAWITGAKASKRRFKPGERVPITVRMKNQKSEDIEAQAAFTIPASYPLRQADLEIRGGAGFSQPEAQPRNLEQMVRLMENRPRSSDLLVRLMQAPPTFAVSGRVLSDLPGFFQRLTLNSVEAAPQVLVQPPYESVPTEWIILGSQRIQIDIETE